MASENEKRETLTGIVAEIRAYGAQPPPRLMWLDIADRIEAAAKRESRAIATEHAVLPAVCISRPSGNAAAMREALVKCREIALQWQADEAAGIAGTTDKPSARSAAEAVIDMEFEINAALSAPARNCDLPNPEERFTEFCSRSSICSSCPHCGSGDLRCDGKWLLATAEEGGAE